MALPDVTSVETERKMQELLHGFLSSYFKPDRETDVVLSSGSATFPAARLVYNEGDLARKEGTDPGLVLHWVFTDLQRKERWVEDGQKEVVCAFLSTVYVRAAAGGKAANQAEFLARKGADCLVLLLQSSSRADLARHGMHRARVMRGPIPMAVFGYYTRMLVVRATVIYRIAP